MSQSVSFSNAASVFLFLLLIFAVFTTAPACFAEVDENQTGINAEEVLSLSEDIFKGFIPEPNLDQAAAIENLADSLVQLARAPGSEYWTKAFVLNLAITGHLMSSLGIKKISDFMAAYLKFGATILPYKMQEYAQHFASTQPKDLQEEFVEFEADIKLISRTTFISNPVPPDLVKKIHLATGVGLALAGAGLFYISSHGIPIFDLMTAPKGLVGPIMGGAGLAMGYFGVKRIYDHLSSTGGGDTPDGNLELMKRVFPVTIHLACQKFLSAQPSQTIVVKAAAE